MTAPRESTESDDARDVPAQPELEAGAPVEVTPPATAGDAPEHQLAREQQRADALQEALQRERADFLNYRRRAAQERDDVSERVRVEVFRALLPALDDLERALRQTPADGTREPWLEGFRLVGRKLLGLLDQAGVVRIGAVGEPFDPRVHEAVGQRPPARPDEGPGSVAEVVRPGYRLGDRVLRPAQVIVVGDAAAPPGDRNAGAAPTA